MSHSSGRQGSGSASSGRSTSPSVSQGNCNSGVVVVRRLAVSGKSTIKMGLVAPRLYSKMQGDGGRWVASSQLAPQGAFPQVPGGGVV